jgi:hypothetical protein
MTPHDHRMTNAMTKILLALLTLAMLTSAASAQQRTFYDASGMVVGRSATDSSGTVTNYDARGKVIQPRDDDRQHDDDLRRRRSQCRQGDNEPMMAQHGLQIFA